MSSLPAASRADETIAEAFGPLADFLIERDPEFWIGADFFNAMRNVDAWIDQEVPIEPGLSYFQDILPRRELVAESEFRRRNCGLIGRH